MDAPVLEAEERDRLTLTELTAGCNRSSPTEVPSASALVTVLMRQLELIAMRHSRIEDALELLRFSWDWQERDMHVEQQTALQVLAEAGQLLDELRDALFRYLGCVGRSSVVQLDDDAMAAAGEIVKERRPWRRWAGNDLVGDCLKYVAASPDAIAAVIAADDRRIAALDVACRSLGKRLAAEDGREPDDDDERERREAADTARRRFVERCRSRVRDSEATDRLKLGADADADHDSEPEPVSEPDGSDRTFAITVTVGEYDQQTDDALDLVISDDRYAALREQVRAVAASFAAEHAASLAASPKTETTARPARDAEPGREANSVEETSTPGA